jgi:hypothetical protein
MNSEPSNPNLDTSLLPLPKTLPAYMTDTRQVRPITISAERHARLGPWVCELLLLFDLVKLICDTITQVLKQISGAATAQEIYAHKRLQDTESVVRPRDKSRWTFLVDEPLPNKRGGLAFFSDINMSGRVTNDLYHSAELSDVPLYDPAEEEDDILEWSPAFSERRLVHDDGSDRTVYGGDDEFTIEKDVTRRKDDGHVGVDSGDSEMEVDASLA